MGSVVKQLASTLNGVPLSVFMCFSVVAGLQQIRTHWYPLCPRMMFILDFFGFGLSWTRAVPELAIEPLNEELKRPP
jgi:hypothetical protein